jgi:hypothetical protein
MRILMEDHLYWILMVERYVHHEAKHLKDLVRRLHKVTIKEPLVIVISVTNIKRYFLLNKQEWYFFIERDKIDWEWYLNKSRSVHLNRTG